MRDIIPVSSLQTQAMGYAAMQQAADPTWIRGLLQNKCYFILLFGMLNTGLVLAGHGTESRVDGMPRRSSFSSILAMALLSPQGKPEYQEQQELDGGGTGGAHTYREQGHAGKLAHRQHIGHTYQNRSHQPLDHHEDILVITNGLGLFDTVALLFSSWGDSIPTFAPVVLFGAVFSKVMDYTGAAKSFANTLYHNLLPKDADPRSAGCLQSSLKQACTP